MMMTDEILLIVFGLIFIIAIVLAVALLLALRKGGSASAASVECVSGPAKGLKAQVKNGRLSIGRGPENDIAIPPEQEPFISEHHADVRQDTQGRFVLEDCDSVHGVWIGDQRVIGQREIEPGARFAIGNSLFQLSGKNVPAGTPSARKIDKVENTRMVNTPPAGGAGLIDGYEVGPRIAEGGQAVVHRAVSRDDERQQVVVKFFRSQATSEELTYLRKKFEQQIVTASQIRHPYCVTVLGGDPRNAPPYLIEEYLPGGTLAQRLNGRPMPMEDVVRMIGQASDALNYLHKRGIVHRDVTPGNLMFDAAGNLKLIDFGVAHVLSSITNTSLGRVLGKPRYMAPEQCKGLRVSPQSDLYSLACIAYECATGQPPFSGQEVDVMRGHIGKQPRPPRELNPAISPVIEKAILKGLEKEPGLRYKNGEEMARAFGYELAMHDGGFTQAGARKLAPNAVALGKSGVLRLQDTKTGKIFEISAPGQTLGRAMLSPDDGTISRQHGRVVIQNGLWQLMEVPDAPSRNGIYYNNMRIGGSESHWLKPGDEIRLGSVYLKVLE